MLEGGEQFLLERLVLPLQIQHRDWRSGTRAGTHGFCGVWHTPWYQPGCLAIPLGAFEFGSEEQEELKKVREPLYCCHIAGIGGFGASVAVPADLSYHGCCTFASNILRMKQEIGIWRTSRHRTFRTLS